jgi:peptidyl-prolyl cis-trans isomerase SurA
MTDSLFHRRQGLAPAFSFALAFAFAGSLIAVAPVASAQSSTATSAAPTAARTTPNVSDYIVAIVNTELVTNAELQSRMARIREEAARTRQALPPEAEFRKQVLDALVDERVLVTNARENGNKIDDAELDRAVQNVAVQNQLTLDQLRARLQQQGMAYGTFRNNVRDQMMVERTREREVNSRIKISDADIDNLIAQKRASTGTAAQLDIAQILITVPDGATDDVVAQKRARAEAALARVKAGEAFDKVAREVSEDGNRAKGGDIGLRPADRLPDLFVTAVKSLKPGEVAPALLRSGAGFHALKLVDRQEASAFSVQQTRARHILLRVSAELPAEAASRRMADFKRQILAGTKTFEELAKANSEDGSAVAGGDLGWTGPGAYVPEFEEAMNALPVGGISDPVVSRFGIHLIQVMDRRTVSLDTKQQREQARNVLKEQKFDEAYQDWVRDLRARAYVEYRDAPG